MAHESQPLEYFPETPETLDPAKPSAKPLITLVMNVLACLLSLMPLLLGIHLAECHVTSEKWCELVAMMELVIAFPLCLLVFVFSVMRVVESHASHLRFAIFVTGLIAIGNAVFLFCAAVSGPWW